MEAFHVILAKNLAAFCPHPEAELKNSASFVWQRKFQEGTISRLWCGDCSPHFPDLERWSIKTGKECGVLKNHVTCLRLKATNRSVQFSGERNVDPVQVEDQAGRG